MTNEATHGGPPAAPGYGPGAPYGAGPGQAPQPPYGAPQGQVPPGQFPPAQFPPAPVQPPAKKSTVGRKVLSILGIIVVALIVIGLKSGVRSFFNDKEDLANAGDCLVGQTESTLKKADCTAANVEWKVAGKVTGKTRAEAEAKGGFEEICKAWQTTEFAFWQGPDTGKGYVLCLEPAKK